MMRTRFVAIVLAASIPAVAFAQKKGGGAGISDASDPAAGSGPSARNMPRSSDLVRMNPAALLIDKKKKLSLSDSVAKQLKAVQKTIDDRNAPIFAQYDSIHKWTMPLSSSSSAAASSKPGFSDADRSTASSASAPSAAEQAKMQSSMRDLRKLVADYREQRKKDVADVLAVVPDAQKPAATDLLTQQDADLDKLVGGRP
jgi:hypothetical protein